MILLQWVGIAAKAKKLLYASLGLTDDYKGKAKKLHPDDSGAEVLSILEGLGELRGGVGNSTYREFNIDNIEVK